MIWELIGSIVFFLLAGMVYRMGGSGNYSRWTREVGVGVLLILELLLLRLFNWGCLGILGTVWIESTYFKKKGSDAEWWNWLLVGLSFSVAILPWFVWSWIVNHKPVHWIGYLVRITVCTGLTLLWQEQLSALFSKWLDIGKDITDEFGRGAIQIITLPLLLI